MAVGSTAYVLAPDPAPTALSGALVWADRSGAARLVLFADGAPTGPPAVLARMASRFAYDVQVRSVDGAASVPAVPATLAPPASADDDPVLRSLLEGAGLEVVVEQGTVRGEVLGLEVARLVRWPVEHGGDGELHLEAGVGRFDRDAVAAMHGGETPEAALARAVEMVRAERYDGAAGHPMARLARDRWLRAHLVRQPDLVGAARLEPVEATVERSSVRDPAPAVAVGERRDGSPVVVVCAVGVDLSLVPVAADARAWLRPGADLLLAVPSRDQVGVQERLAAMLREPATVVGVPAPWGTA